MDPTTVDKGRYMNINLTYYLRAWQSSWPIIKNIWNMRGEQLQKYSLQNRYDESIQLLPSQHTEKH